jgi:hypothetical protein
MVRIETRLGSKTDAWSFIQKTAWSAIATLLFFGPSNIIVSSTSRSCVAKSVNPTVVITIPPVAPSASKSIAKTINPNVQITSSGGVTVSPAAVKSIAKVSVPSIVISIAADNEILSMTSEILSIYSVLSMVSIINQLTSEIKISDSLKSPISSKSGLTSEIIPIVTLISRNR